MYRIYHLACPASPEHYQRDPVHTLYTCFCGTQNVLKLAGDHGARVLLASTSEVYGDPDVHPQPESYHGNVNTFGPRACYDEGKRVAESLMWAYQNQPPPRCSKVDVRIARIFNTYGPRMHARDGRVISSFINAKLKGEPLPLTGDRTTTRSFCYISDMVDGLMRLMESNYREGPINLGGIEEISLLSLGRLISLTVKRVRGLSSRCDLTEAPDILDLPERQDEPKRRKPDLRLARCVLDWKPMTPLKFGLERTVEWMMRTEDRGLMLHINNFDDDGTFRVFGMTCTQPGESWGPPSMGQLLYTASSGHHGPQQRIVIPADMAPVAVLGWGLQISSLRPRDNPHAALIEDHQGPPLGIFLAPPPQGFPAVPRHPPGGIDGQMNGQADGPVDGRVNGQVNGQSIGHNNAGLDGANDPLPDFANGRTNGQMNGRHYGGLDGADDPIMGHANGRNDGHLNDRVQGWVNGRVNGGFDGEEPDPVNHRVNDHADYHANGQASGHANGHANGLANNSVDSYVNGYDNGHANGHANGHVNGNGHGGMNGLTNGDINGLANDHDRGDVENHDRLYSPEPMEDVHSQMSQGTYDTFDTQLPGDEGPRLPAEEYRFMFETNQGGPVQPPETVWPPPRPE